MASHLKVVLLVTVAFAAGTLVPTVRSQVQGTGEFVVVNYMKVPPGGGANYVALERNFYKASHQARVQAGKLKSWSLWQVRFPGTETPYSYATINAYSKWEDLDASTQEFMQKTNAGKDLADIQRQTQAAREISRTEIWRVLDQTR